MSITSWKVWFLRHHFCERVIRPPVAVSRGLGRATAKSAKSGSRRIPEDALPAICGATSLRKTPIFLIPIIVKMN